MAEEQQQSAPQGQGGSGSELIDKEKELAEKTAATEIFWLFIGFYLPTLGVMAFVMFMFYGINAMLGKPIKASNWQFWTAIILAFITILLYVLIISVIGYGLCTGFTGIATKIATSIASFFTGSDYKICAMLGL